MRQGQQNRRGRGRHNNAPNNNNNSNNNRKSQNPLTRSFESTGPDVKVRGTPSHVAEKYISLARDALSSGDRVLAENYLQHAEHYNRIILTYREQQMSQGGEFTQGLPRAQTFNAQDPMDGEDFTDEEVDEATGNVQPNASQNEGHAPNLQNQHSGQGQQSNGSHQQRPYDGPRDSQRGDGQRGDGQRYDNRQPRHDNQRDHRPQHNQPRQDRDGNRFDRNNDRNNNDRGFNRNDQGPREQSGMRHENRPDRNGDRNGFGGEQRDDRGQPGFPDQGSPASQGGGESQERNFNGNGNGGSNGQRRRERFANTFGGDRQPSAPGFAAQPAVAPAAPVPPSQPLPVAAAPEAEQPAFLRRPVRRPRRDDSETAVPVAPKVPASDDQE